MRTWFFQGFNLPFSNLALLRSKLPFLPSFHRALGLRQVRTINIICSCILMVKCRSLWAWMSWVSLLYHLLARWPSCSVAKLCPTLCYPINCSKPGFPVLHYLLELIQTHVHWVGDAIQPSHPLSPPSLPTFNLSQHQGLFQWVSSSHQVAKGLELQHPSFHGIFRIDFL